MSSLVKDYPLVNFNKAAQISENW